MAKTRARPVKIQHDTRFPPSPSPAEEWVAFGKRLELVLADMEEDEILIVFEKGERNVYVQFYAQGNFGMHVEAVSNEYIEKEHRLDRTGIEALRKIGWRPPMAMDRRARSKPRAGSPNFFIDTGRPVPYELLADAAIRALRDVYRTLHPGDLMYKTFCAEKAPEQYQFRFPTLGLRRSS